MHDLYDLVKVKIEEHEDPDVMDFDGGLGIIDEVAEDIDGATCYKLLFVGKYHNNLSSRVGIPMFYDNELEGI